MKKKKAEKKQPRYSLRRFCSAEEGAKYKEVGAFNLPISSLVYFKTKRIKGMYECYEAQITISPATHPQVYNSWQGVVLMIDNKMYQVVGVCP